MPGRPPEGGVGGRVGEKEYVAGQPLPVRLQDGGSCSDKSDVVSSMRVCGYFAGASMALRKGARRLARLRGGDGKPQGQDER